MRRGLFQWNYFFIIFPIHILVVLFTIAPLPLTIAEIWRWTAMALITYGITAVAFGVARYFQNSLKSTVQEVIAAVLVGVVRGFAILDVSLLMGLPTVKPYILRPLNSAISFPLWLLIIHLLLGTRREFLNEFHKMYVRAITSQISASKAASKATAEELSSRIEQSLQPLRQQFERVLGTKISTQQLADEALIIRSFVDAEIRPLSHELWRSRKFQPPKLGFLKILSQTMLNTRLPLHLVHIPAFIFSLVGLTTYYNFQTAISIVLPIMGLMLLWNLSYNLLEKRGRVSTPLLNSITLLLGTFAPTIVIEIQRTSLETNFNRTVSEIIGGLWFLLLIVGFTTYRGVNYYYESIKAIMQREIDSMGIGESGMAGTRLRREFASYLHGDIQSELLSASMQMSQAAETGNIKMGKKALKRADDLLKRDHQTYIVGSAIASRKKLERLAEAWRGIAEIEFVLNEKDLFSDSTFEVITDVMEELVTNAIRHGSASTIRSMIAREGGAIRVTFEDNGTEIKGRKKGLGSEILKKRTLSYHYERTSQGNRIEIELPD
jgi:hypothetical protein